MKKNKFSVFKHRVQHLPVALTGLSLGLAGLATALDLILRNNINLNFSSYNA